MKNEMYIKQGNIGAMVPMYPEIHERMMKLWEEDWDKWTDRQLDLYGEARRQLEAEGWELPMSPEWKDRIEKARKLMEMERQHSPWHCDLISPNTFV